MTRYPQGAFLAARIVLVLGAAVLLIVAGFAGSAAWATAAALAVLGAAVLDAGCVVLLRRTAPPEIGYSGLAIGVLVLLFNATGDPDVAAVHPGTVVAAVAVLLEIAVVAVGEQRSRRGRAAATSR